MALINPDTFPVGKTDPHYSDFTQRSNYERFQAFVIERTVKANS